MHRFITIHLLLAKFSPRRRWRERLTKLNSPEMFSNAVLDQTPTLEKKKGVRKKQNDGVQELLWK